MRRRSLTMRCATSFPLHHRLTEGYWTFVAANGAGAVQEQRTGVEAVSGAHEPSLPIEPSANLPKVDQVTELMLIDENLSRNDLTPAERAAAQARRKKLYQQLHPETKNGETGRGRPKNSLANLAKLTDGSEQPKNADAPQGNGFGTVPEMVSEPSLPPADSPAPRYDEAAAKATGQSERAVRREVQRGEALGEDVLAKVARTSLDKGEELDALAKLPESLRDEAVKRAVAGG